MQNNILVGIISLIILALLIVAIVVKRKYPRPTDYYTFFWTGLLWIGVGIIMEFFADGGYFFLIMGIAFTVIGLANRKKWRKNRIRWKDLKKPERIIQGILIGILAFLIGAGIAYLIIRTRGLI